jgi:ribonuclease P protein component
LQSRGLKRRRDDLTTRSRARSNTALFRTGDGDEADLSTFQDAPCAAPWFSRTQPHQRRTCGTAQSALARASPARAVAASGKRLGLDAERRLTKKEQFERLLREGRRIKVAGYTFYVQRRNEGAPRLGLLVTRKHAARATERNRIKRCVREAFRLEQETLGAVDLLVRPPYGIEPSPKTLLRLRAILSSLNVT